ncbi:MAG: cellulase family glycosylhydrolase [Patescibacteria group bacterium]
MLSFLKRKPSLNRDAKKGIKLIKKLFTLKLTRLILIILALIVFSPLIAFVALRPKVSEEINYGVTFSNKYAEELGLDWRNSYIKVLDDLGAKNLRLVVYWDETEPTNNEYSFDNIKFQLDEAEKRDVNVILTMGRKVPRWPECFEPAWWKKISREVDRDAQLYEFIATTTSELKDYKTIKKWQVENEPFFPFGECEFEIKRDTLKNEIDIVREIDNRPILVQDSGEGGYWYPSYKLGDYLGISMYRRIWYDFWGIFLGNHIYFKYPLAHWSYKIKAETLQVPPEKIIVTELQAEPWGPGINSKLTTDQKNKTMSRDKFIDTIAYAQKSGFNNLYLWGVEWWLWEKEVNNNAFYWDTAKALFN